jgi:hypothetical protein
MWIRKMLPSGATGYRYEAEVVERNPELADQTEWRPGGLIAQMCLRLSGKLLDLAR